MKEPNLLTPVVRLAHGLGGAPSGIVTSGLSMFILLFYNRVLGVPADLVGTALAVALIFDAISDPLVGIVSDKFHSAWGRRLPFMYVAILPVSLLVYALWNPPVHLLSSGELFLYLLAVVIPLRLFLTCFDVPSNALIPEITSSYEERTSLALFRVSANWVAVTGIAMLLYGYWLRDTPEFPNGLMNASGYAEMGVYSALLIFLAMLLSSTGLHRLIPRLQRPAAKHQWHLRKTISAFADTLTDPNLLPLLAGSIVISAGFSAYGALHVYMFSYFWELSTAQIAGVLFAWGVGVIFGVAITPFFSRGREKRHVALRAIVLLGLVDLIPITLRLFGWFLPPTDAFYYPVILLIVTAEMGFYIVLMAILTSMIADVAEKRELSTGNREEGAIFSAQSLIGKSGSALGVWMAGQILVTIGFPSGQAAPDPSTEEVKNLAVSILPIFIVLYPVAMAFIWRFRIDRSVHESDLARLQTMRTMQNGDNVDKHGMRDK